MPEKPSVYDAIAKLTGFSAEEVAKQAADHFVWAFQMAQDGRMIAALDEKTGQLDITDCPVFEAAGRLPAAGAKPVQDNNPPRFSGGKPPRPKR